MCKKCHHKKESSSSSDSTQTETVTDVKQTKCKRKIVYKKAHCKSCVKKVGKPKGHKKSGCKACHGY